VNDFRFGFVHINDSLVNVPPVTVTDLGIDRPTNNITKSIYKFTLGSSGFQIGPTPPADQFQNQNTFNFVDMVSWVHGAHVLRFGGDYTRIILDKLFPQTFNGQLFFVNSPGGETDFQKLVVGAPDFSFGGGGVFNHQYRNNTTYKNDYTTGLGPRLGFAWDVFGDHTTTVRGGYGIYFVREDVGTVDQLSFQAPYLPIAFGGGAPGSLSNFFLTGMNALPQAGALDPNFVPCLGVLQNFPGGDTRQFPNYACAAGSTGLVPSQFLFVLTVPRDFMAPNTQQWNLTIQRAFGKNWVFEAGYIGTHALHLRETRTSIQGKLATAANPLTVTAEDGTPFVITESTTGNGVARSNLQGL